MTPEKLKANLNKLRQEVARKPAAYTPDYAKSIDESFKKYTRTRTINLLSSANEVLWSTIKWPFPLFGLSGKLSALKLTLSMLYSGIFFISKTEDLFDEREKFKRIITKCSLCFFKLNKNLIFNHIKNHPTLNTKKYFIDDIYKTYQNKLWYPCITSTTPLLDFIFRQYFQTSSLDKDIKSLLSTLKKAQIDTNIDIKTASTAYEKAQEIGATPTQSEKNDLRLIGIALGSFLDFSNDYYDWFRKDQGSDEYNRHAFLHGASNKECTKEDATKLIEFLDLTLRLEPVFKILLKED